LENSSTLWLRRKLGDQYTRKAHEENYVSRSAFKLLQIQSKYRIFKRSDTVIDLGAAPGGWTQVALRFVGGKMNNKKETHKKLSNSTTNTENESQSKLSKKIGKVISVDIKELHPAVKGSVHLQVDFTNESAVEKLVSILNNEKVDAVLSDMAPSFIGTHEIDHMRLMVTFSSLVVVSLEFFVFQLIVVF
jgi:23S rRNA (uridine2552-2'-O)-methyltransferase